MPNATSEAFTYDNLARPLPQTSLHGAVTTMTYNDASSPRTRTATTNGRWVRTTSDGFGRTIKAETGHGATSVSAVETEYAPCACSPLGKVSRVSQP